MSKRIKLGTTLVATLIITVSGTAFAADGAAIYTAKGCAACHGADAKTPIMPAYPKIAGQAKEYTYQQMIDIKSGARNNGQTAAMKGIIAGVSDDEIKVLSEYLETLK
ncbi:MAG TPA: cytochrome c [Leucothrix mucor]|uniref:Cytochrome c n=1 Tax=Leucothrix mucor TaxID=45248 RepID=A0A7V2SZB4_LEUMU|nr:cytochrome c [Leucothrix mucor]